MSGYSDIIKELSYTTPLNSSISHTTERIIAGQYSSLNISFASDTDTTVVIQFSNDGINFDISITKSFSAGSDYQSLVIYGKWMRYIITNISVNNQTYLRIYTYASPDNTSLNAVISKVGNKYPEIQIQGLPKSAFGEIKTQADLKLVDYIYVYGSNGIVGTNAFKTLNESIKGYSASNFAFLRFDSGLMHITNSVLQLGVGAMIYGKSILYDAGSGIIARFTGRFRQETTRQANKTGFQYQLLGLGNEDGSGAIVDFLGWGNIDTTTQGLSAPKFGIHHFRNGVLINTYLQSQWNIDKCDGTNIFPALNFNDYLNIFQIQMQYLGAGAITFLIENPDTGLFEPVHMIKYANANTITNLSNPSMGLMLYQRTDATGVPVADNDGIYTASFSLSIEGIIGNSSYIDCIYNSKTILATTNTNILTIRNGATFYGSRNRIPVRLYLFNASTDGNKNVVIYLLKNQTLGGVPAYTAVNADRSPIEYDTAGTIGAFDGRNMITFFLAKVDKTITNILEYEILLFPGDTLSMVAYSTNGSDVSVSISWKNL